MTGEIKKNVHLRYPNYGGTLATGGNLTSLHYLTDWSRRRATSQCPALISDAADIADET
jgi:hypothetical protein